MALTAAQQFVGCYIANGVLDMAPGGYMTALADVINANGTDYRAITKAVVGTSLFTDQFPTYLSNEQFAANYATKLLGTSVTAANMKVATDYITGQLNAGVSRGDAVYQVLEFLYTQPSTNADWGTAAATLQNKASVAQYYTVDKLGASTDLATLRSVTSSVTDAASVVTAKASIDATVTSGSGSSTGSSNGTYTLASDVDTVVEGKTATFTVTRSGDVTAAKTLTFNASGDTNNTTVAAAAAGVDASPASGTVTFAAGATTATFTVSAAADTAVEGLEGLRVRLFDGTTAVADKVVLINDDTSSTSVPGTTYTLTKDANNFVGTAGNDTFDAGLVSATTPASEPAIIQPTRMVFV